MHKQPELEHKPIEQREVLKERNINTDKVLKYTDDRICYYELSDDHTPSISTIPINDIKNKDSAKDCECNNKDIKENKNIYKNESNILEYIKNKYFSDVSKVKDKLNINYENKSTNDLNIKKEYNYDKRMNDSKENIKYNSLTYENYKDRNNFNNVKSDNIYFKDIKYNYNEHENNINYNIKSTNDINYYKDIKNNNNINNNIYNEYNYDYISNNEYNKHINTNECTNDTYSINTKNTSYNSIKKQIDLDLLILNRYLYSDNSKEILERIRINTQLLKEAFLNRIKNKFKERILNERSFYEERIKKLELKIKKYKKILEEM